MDHYASLVCQIRLSHKDLQTRFTPINDPNEAVSQAVQLYFYPRQLPYGNSEISAFLPRSFVVAAAGEVFKRHKLNWLPCVQRKQLNAVVRTLHGDDARVTSTTHRANEPLYFCIRAHLEEAVEEHLTYENGIYRFSAPELVAPERKV